MRGHTHCFSSQFACVRYHNLSVWFLNRASTMARYRKSSRDGAARPLSAKERALQQRRQQQTESELTMVSLIAAAFSCVCSCVFVCVLSV